MGVYPVNCPTCNKVHLWFSGTMDQRCSDCVKANPLSSDKRPIYQNASSGTLVTYFLMCGICGIGFHSNTYSPGSLITCDACRFMEANKELMDDLAELEEKEKKLKEVEVFVDGVDWNWEIGEASDGNKVYPGLESLKENNSCWEVCGIVKCTISFKEWVVKPKDWNAENSGENETTHDIMRLQEAKKTLNYLENRLDKQKQIVVDLEAKLVKVQPENG